MNEHLGSTIQNHDPTKPVPNTTEKYQYKYRIHTAYQPTSVTHQQLKGWILFYGLTR
jgi:hypothetical protein